MLPAVQKVREAANRAQAQESLLRIVEAINTWKEGEDGPRPLEMATLCSLLPEFCDQAQSANALVKGGYAFVVGPDDPQTGDYIVTAEPVLPGKTGMLNLITSGSGHFRAYVHPSAVEEQRRMFEALRRRGERMVADLVTKAPGRLKAAFRHPQDSSLGEAFRALNANGDDVLTLNEIQAYPVLDLGQSLGEMLSLNEIMGLGAGGEYFLNLSVGLFELTPCERGRDDDGERHGGE